MYIYICIKELTYLYSYIYTYVYIYIYVPALPQSHALPPGLADCPGPHGGGPWPSVTIVAGHGLALTVHPKKYLESSLCVADQSKIIWNIAKPV